MDNIHELISALANGSEKQRISAIRSLAHTRDEQAIKALIDFYHSTDNFWLDFVIIDELKAILESGWTPTSLSEKIKVATILGKWSELVGLGKEGVEALVREAINAIGGIEYFAGALVKCDDERIPGILLEGFRRARSPSAKETIMRALGQRGDLRAVQPMIEALADKELVDTATDALWVLMKRHLDSIPTEELKVLISIPGLVKICHEYETTSDGHGSYVTRTWEEPVDMTTMQSMARYALFKRIVSATTSDATSLIKSMEVGINLPDYYGNTLLHWAIRAEKADLVEWLLELGADPHIRSHLGNRNALDVARLRGNNQIIDQIQRSMKKDV